MIMILAITTGGFLLTAIFAAPSLSINAITPKNIIEKTLVNNGSFLNRTGTTHNNVPQINGTISIKNISVPFSTAAQTAEKEITNGTIELMVIWI